MRIYYLPTPVSPGRHRIIQCVWDRDAACFDDREISRGGVMANGRLVLLVDETATNLPELLELDRSFAPRKPKWLVAPPAQLVRPNGTLWSPVTNSERQNLFDPLPGPVGILAFLAIILADGAATPREKQIARILTRIVRRLRQHNQGAPED